MSEKEHKCCGGHGGHEGCCGGHHHEGHEGCCGGHHHHEDHHHEEQYLTVLLENDEQLKCSVLDIFEVNDNQYIALLPVGDDQVLLYRYVEHNDDEGFELLNIETDEEFEAVEEAFFDIFNEEFFEEEDYDYDDYDDEEDEEE